MITSNIFHPLKDEQQCVKELMMKSPCILVIDDDRSFLEAVEIFLEDNGFEVSKAPNGRQGIDLEQNHNFDLAIVDVHLPDISGVEVAESLLKHHPGLPVIMISSDDTDMNVRRCMKNSISRFVSKPIAPHLLLQTIAVSLNDGKSRRT